MQAQIQRLLRPIRSRLTRQQAMPRVATALLAGGWLAMVAALLTLFGGSFTSGLIGIVVAVTFPILAWGWSQFTSASWDDAARLVDRKLRLHNRTSTALQLAGDQDPFAALQIEDALSSLQQANLKSIELPVPWQRIVGGLVLTLFAVSLIIWGIVAPPSAAIQTSGDMQDIRPEIADRTLVDPGPITSEMIAESATLLGDSESEFQQSIGVDVAQQYFNSLSD